MLASLLVYAVPTGHARRPHWKPASPKRFAWLLGFLLVNTCFLAWLLEVRVVVLLSVLTCCVLTWLECAMGFCMGCWIYNSFVVPMMGKEECGECKL